MKSKLGFLFADLVNVFDRKFFNQTDQISRGKIIFKRRVTTRAFEKNGISLKVDGPEDAEKIKFQGQEIGILRVLIFDQFDWKFSIKTVN